MGKHNDQSIRITTLLTGHYYNDSVKNPCATLAQSHESLLDPPNTNGAVILHSKMTGAVSVLVAHAHVVCVLRIISWGQNTF